MSGEFISIFLASFVTFFVLIDALGVDGAFLHRNADRPFQLVPVEILALAVGLDHHQIAQLNALIGGKTAPAGRTKTAAPDRYVIFGRPTVFDLSVYVAAKRTAHCPSPSQNPACGRGFPLFHETIGGCLGFG